MHHIARVEVVEEIADRPTDVDARDNKGLCSGLFDPFDADVPGGPLRYVVTAESLF